jgi:hypothetical protein
VAKLDPSNLAAFVESINEDVNQEILQAQEAAVEQNAAEAAEGNNEQNAANNQEVATAVNNEANGGDGGTVLTGDGGAGGDISGGGSKFFFNLGSDAGDGCDTGGNSADGGAAVIENDTDVDVASDLVQDAENRFDQEIEERSEVDQDEDADNEFDSAVS